MARRFDYHHQQQHQQAGRRTLAAFCFAFVLFLLVAAYLFSGFKPGTIPTSSVVRLFLDSHIVRVRYSTTFLYAGLSVQDEDQDRAGDGLGGPNTSDALGDEPAEHEIRDSSKLSLNLPPVKGAGEPADSDMEPPGKAADEEEGSESAAQEGLRGAGGGDARAQAEKERDAQDAAAQEEDSEGGDGQEEEGLLHSRTGGDAKEAGRVRKSWRLGNINTPFPPLPRCPFPIGQMMGDENGNFSVGGKIRTVLDIGCGVASFGAYLLEHSVLTMSVAPNDVHENQIQFALERGLPAFLGVMGTQRLPFPSLAFDLAHCSRCRIDWLQRDGLLLLELDRVIRPGGYWVWSAPPVYREDEENQKLWTDMLAFMGRMCWKVKAQSGQTAIFKKPKTNLCIKKRAADTEPSLCDAARVSPNSAWYTPMDACVNTVPKGKKNKLIQPWPERLVSPSPRIDLLGLAKSDFEADTEAWEKIVADYDTLLGGQALLRPADSSSLKAASKSKGSKAAFPMRNVIDINAHMGGFAAALAAQGQEVWVMNTVPPQGEASGAGLAMVYDRGLIGVFHDWCEPFSTYPRTYDLVHAWRAVSQVLKRKCSLEALLLELDRILRPKGVLLFRDSADVIARLEKRLKAVKWVVLKGPVSRTFIDGEEEEVLIVQKRFWRMKEKAGLKESAEAAASTDGDAEERRRL
ncbi:unnamed protein product [Closterium sp. NIES-54]